MGDELCDFVVYGIVEGGELLWTEVWRTLLDGYGLERVDSGGTSMADYYQISKLCSSSIAHIIAGPVKLSASVL